jgi:hypothetical protein
MKSTSKTPSVRVAIAVGLASMLAIASSPAWSQSLVGDGWAGSIQPNSRYCRIDRTSGHCQWPYASAAAQDQGNADWR